MKIESFNPINLPAIRLSRTTGFWLGLWGFTTILAWSLAFTFNPPRPYAYSIKILHVLVFLPWSVTSIRSWRKLSGWPADGRLELGALVFVAALVELSERWIPGHDPDWVGFSCSCLGAVLAIALVRRSDRRRHDPQPALRTD